MFPKILKNYLRFWARLYLKRVKPEIIAVTGSAGKTSTKEVIFEVLKAGFGNQVRKSEGNLNTIYGVSLAILGFKKPPVPLDRLFSPWAWIPVLFSAPIKIWANSQTKYLVLEIAADKPGDVKFITTFVKPTISVITNIGSAHLEIFGSLEKIIQEKTQILHALKEGGTAVLNIDDKTLEKISESGNFKTITFALEKQADVVAKNITTEIIQNESDKTLLPLTKFQIVTEKNKFLAQTHTLGREANVYPALASTAVAEILSLKSNAIIEGLKNVRPEKHRMQVFHGKNASIIIDDVYNANPLSVKSALNTLKILPSQPVRQSPDGSRHLSGGRKIAVLGDMLELGKISEDAHKLIGGYALQVADIVLSIGEKAGDYGAEKKFSDKDELKIYLLNEARKGDIILIKASRGMALEEIVEALKQ
ncbi:MAG: hypothetical protein HW405_868 [Candidatus Berkelbacteria bacterium]|nr:hypothetical protein [Candidatus Berkelbacteria bacterium]